MTDRKPPKIYLENEADLENLIVGDQVKVTLAEIGPFSGNIHTRWTIYEGTLYEMECFAYPANVVFPERGIISLRNKKEELEFTEGGIIIYLWEAKIYSNNSPEYQNTKKLLKQAGLIG